MTAQEVAEKIKTDDSESSELIKNGECEAGIKLLYRKGMYDLAFWVDNKLGEGILL